MLICNDLHKVQEHPTALENRVSDIEDTVPPLTTEVKTVTRRLNTVITKVEVLENLLRHNNVWVGGIPEEAEGNDPIEFTEQWLMDIVGKEHFSTLFAVERAHRFPTQPLLP